MDVNDNVTHIQFSLEVSSKTVIKEPGILKGCVNKAKNWAPFAHFLSERFKILTQAHLSNGMTKFMA